jgi:CDP-glucose 4,6-dehydratase
VEALVDNEFWNGRRVLITGHTGFKGSWLLVMLEALGARVAGYALSPPTSPSLYAQISGELLCEDNRGDIRDLDTLRRIVSDFDPHILIHLAAQPIVLEASKLGVETMEINVIGTARVLEAARSARSLQAVLSVTTDKVYENREWCWGYRETDSVGGHEPYGASKACAEIVTAAWAKSFLEPAGIRVATARAGNVIGGGDWAPARLVPDAIRAWRSSESLNLRSPMSIRPWQHVMEPLSGYLALCQSLVGGRTGSIRALNLGPRDEDARPVIDVCRLINKHLPEPIELRQEAVDHGGAVESRVLRLDSSLAKSVIDWGSRLTLEQAVELTVEWYVSVASGSSALEICRRQFDWYRSKSQGLMA